MDVVTTKRFPPALDNFSVMSPKRMRINSAIMKFRAGNPWMEAVIQKTVSSYVQFSGSYEHCPALFFLHDRWVKCSF